MLHGIVLPLCWHSKTVMMHDESYTLTIDAVGELGLENSLKVAPLASQTDSSNKSKAPTIHPACSLSCPAAS